MSAPALNACPGCGSEVPDGRLACPVCLRLVHAERLKALAAEADRAEAAGERAAALAAWNEVLTLLPAGVAQVPRVQENIDRLEREVAGKKPAPSRRGTGGANAAKLGAIAILVAIASKAKLLFAGLAKAGSLLSIALSFGVYWQAFGWKLAAGLIGSIYIHELGHMVAFLRYGIHASAPMFIPGLGAFVRARVPLDSPVQRAWIGLAGPMAGTLAAAVCLLLAQQYGWPAWHAFAVWGARINLFNLIPVWQLDGAHAFASMNRPLRVLAAAGLAALWYFGGEGTVVLLAIAAAFQAFSRRVPESRSPLGPWFVYAALVVILVWLATAPPVALP